YEILNFADCRPGSTTRQSKALQKLKLSDQRSRYITSSVAVCQFSYNSCCTAKVCVLFSRAPCSTRRSSQISRPKQAHRRSKLRESKFAWSVCHSLSLLRQA